MVFIPRGYVPLTLVVHRLKTQFASDANTSFECARLELQKVTEQLTFTSGTSSTSGPSGPSGSRLILQIPNNRTRAEDLTEEQRVHFREMARQAQRVRTVRQIVVNVLQQDLGMGDATAIALSHTGEIIEIPMRAWRTRAGELAFEDGGISWADPKIGRTPRAEVFVADAVIARWIDMVGKAVGSMIEEPASIDTRSGQRPMPVGRAADKDHAPEFVNRRVSVSGEKVKRWMLDATTAAKCVGKNLGRDNAVEQCQAELNCTREVARAAYTALPEVLKRPRGKAIRKPA